MSAVQKINLSWFRTHRNQKNETSSHLYILCDCIKLLCDQIHEKGKKFTQYLSDVKLNEETS
jgi:hypothetical protein